MNLHHLLKQRAAAGKPVRVGLIGAGKFGSMFLSQVPTMTGLEVSVIADLDPERARAACSKVGWDARRIARTLFVASGTELCPHPKRDLSAGDMLDGEGGCTVWGKLVPAARSVAEGALPIGLAHHVRLTRGIAAGGTVRWADVAIADSEAVAVRRDMERHFAARPSSIAAQ